MSLPLRSPVDNVFNTATVAAAALVVGVAGGLIWDGLAANQRRLLYFAGALGLGLIAVVVIAVVGNIWLDRLVSFAIPLAAIAFLVSECWRLSWADSLFPHRGGRLRLC